MKNYIQLGKDKINISDETAENLRKQFAEPKREIRKGDCFLTEHGQPQIISRIYYRGTVEAIMSGSWGVDWIRDQWIFLFNIFDIMAEAGKGKKEYEVAAVNFRLAGDTIYIEDRYIFSCPENVDALLKAACSLAIQHKKEANKCKS
jgi:hypothetical protein